MKYILLVIITIIITFLFYFYIYKNEYFIDNEDDYTYINDNILNIDKKKQFAITTSKLVDIIDFMEKNNKISKNIISIPTDKFKLLIDPYISKFILNNTIEVNSSYKDGIFVCLSNTRLGKEKCIWDFNGKTIAYIYMSDYLFIQAIIKAYRQDITKIKLKNIKLEDLKSIRRQFDYLFTYVVLDSEYMKLLKYSRYYINGLTDFDISRLIIFYPVIKYNYNKIRYYFNKYDKDTTFDIFLNNDNVLIPIMNYDIIKNIEFSQLRENFITRLELPRDYLQPVDRNYSNKNDANINDILNKGIYACYGNNNITRKYECVSYYTKEGRDKNYYSIWDKKCSSNVECPYYKANTKYDNDRGGCINGYCELPVGVKRIGFTKYNDSNYNQPFCYECQDTTDLNCCGNIKNKKNPYKNDFVFEDDSDYRKRSNLNTIISLLDYKNIIN